MSCKVKIKLINDLANNGAIDPKSQIIVDSVKFDELNTEYTKLARDKYDLDLKGDLFSVVDSKGKIKAKANETALDVLDAIIDEYTAEENDYDVLNTPEDSTDTESQKKVEDLEDENTEDFLEDEAPFEDSFPEDYDLSDMSKKLEHKLNSIKDNIEENLRLYDIYVKSAKDPAKLKLYSKKLRTLLSDIEKLDKIDRWRGLALYVDELDANIRSLRNRFNNEKFTGKKDVSKTIEIYRKYLASHALINDIQELLVEAMQDPDTPVEKSELKRMNDKLIVSQGIYTNLDKKFKVYLRKSTIKKLSNPKYALEVTRKWRDKLGKEWKQLNIGENKTSWVNRQMATTHKAEIDQEISDYMRKLVESPAYDISLGTYLFNASINTNSKFIQIFQAMLNEIKEKLISLSRSKDFVLQGLSEKLIAEKGNLKPSELYKNIVEFNSKGNAYLRGEYSVKFKEEYDNLSTAYQEEHAALLEKYGEKSREYKTHYQNSEFKKWILKNTYVKDVSETEFPVLSRIVPIDKWLNDFSGVSQIELDVLEEFKNITKEASKNTFGISSLVGTPVFSAEFMRLPSITKSNLERVLEGTMKGSIKDSWADLTEVRPDDVGYEEGNVDMAGDPLYHVKVHFRGNLDKTQQSLDLFNIYRLEYRNGINFSEKHAAEKDLTTLLEIVKDKKFYKTTGLRIPLVGKFVKRNKRTIKPGSETNTYSKMVSMMESNLYDILHKNAGKLGSIDTNKAVRFLNGWTAKVGMSLNEVTATTNVLNGKAQLFLESVAGNFISAKSLMKAEQKYFAQMPELFKDISNPVKKSFINQLNEMFDVEGVISVSVKQAFLKNTMMKATADLGTLQFMQDSGEHWLQSVLSMGVLDGIKVMDENHNLLDKDGNVTNDEKNGASLYDMLEMKDGILQVNPKVTYTTYSTNIKYDEGGKELVNNLIKKKLFDNYGNYAADLQPEAMRHVAGKFLMMYRKFLIPMGIARYRGFGYFTKEKDKLKDHQKFFSDALQEYEEGFYTSLARFLWTGAIPALKKMQLEILTTKWDELSDMEKRNIYKSVAEMGMTMVVLPLQMMALGMLVGGDDTKKDSAFVYFLLLQTARLQSELSSFRNIQEQYRILNNPIPAVNVLKSLTSLAGTAMTPWTWGDTYTSGERKGQLRVRRKVEKLTPILNSTNISYKEKYEFITNIKLY